MKKHKKSAPKRHAQVKPSRRKDTISSQRIVIYGFLAVVFAFVVALPLKGHVTQTVAGAQIMRGMFNQATITIPQQSGAVAYNIYYQTTSDSSFGHAVRKLPAGTTRYLISYLKKGVIYQYKISAVNARGAEFWWSPVTQITNPVSM